MNNGKIEVDTGRINELFNALKMTNKEAKAAIKGGLRRSAQVIQRQARMNLKGVTNEATGKPLNARTLLPYVRVTVYKSAQGARVDVMDDKRKSTNIRLSRKGKENKSFILKFFATGTEPRYTKSHIRTGIGRDNIKRKGKGGYRGRIGNSKFFKMAVEAKKVEAEKMLEDAIVDYISKIIKRRK